MLGFSSLAENPLSGLMAEIFKLEASSLLESISIINGNGLIKFFNNSISQVTSELNGFLINKSLSTADLYILSELETSSKIKVPSNTVFAGNSSFDLDYLTRVTAGQSLDIFSSTILDSYIRTRFNVEINNFSNFEPVGTIKLFDSFNFTGISNVNSFPVIRLSESSYIFNESDFLSEVSSRVIGNIIAESSANIDNPEVLIKSYISMNFNADAEFYTYLSNISFNEVNFEIIGVFSSNLSQRNRDVVYYILAIEKSKPLELKILRAK